MKLDEFNFDLPHELIAQYPVKDRVSCRLLKLDGNTGKYEDLHFRDVLDLVEPGDLMVFNNTKVIPARMFGTKSTGGKVEVLLERMTGEREILAHLGCSHAPKEGGRLIFSDGIEAEVTGRDGDLFMLRFNTDDVLGVFNKYGHIPLPPYINRSDEPSDRVDYQTVYGTVPGAVASPTAGLHFTDELLDEIRKKGVRTEFVTLHVGSGTFQPVKEDRVEDHHMHSEYIEVPESVTKAVAETKRAGHRVIAVGTTSVRSLESCAKFSGSDAEHLKPYFGETDIFIYPGYEYSVCDCLITNFHLPCSTLIMLVAAFAGYHHTLDAYNHAVESKYRFFSYGDAMFITKKTVPGDVMPDGEPLPGGSAENGHGE